MFESLAQDKFFSKLDQIRCGRLSVTCPDGGVRVFEGCEAGQNAAIEIRDWRIVANLVRKGDIGFGEDYRDGLWDSPDLIALLTFALENKKALDKFVLGSPLSRLLARLSYLLRLNTVRGSRKNIHAHYDLGNEFYKLWLDPSMTYSSALFTADGQSLQQGQSNKYQRILDSLDAGSGNVLEIGCGWGGFAEHALGAGDYDIKGLTLSERQHVYANDRLQGRANIAIEDYRHQDGRYDNIVSIEMFEAVGERYWGTYFDKVASLLKRGGKAVVQTITIDDGDFERYRRGGDFIRSYIFPGGMLPSIERFCDRAKDSGLRAGGVHCFGLDYARTLKVWLKEFDEKRAQVLSMGFDDAFIRLWRFYLAACAAGFLTGRTDVMQVELVHI